MHLSTEEPAASRMLEPLEKLAEMFLNTFHREHILLKLKTKKLLRKIKSKNLTAGVYFVFLMDNTLSLELKRFGLESSSISVLFFYFVNLFVFFYFVYKRIRARQGMTKVPYGYINQNQTDGASAKFFHLRAFYENLKQLS